LKAVWKRPWSATRTDPRQSSMVDSREGATAPSFFSTIHVMTVLEKRSAPGNRWRGGRKPEAVVELLKTRRSVRAPNARRYHSRDMLLFPVLTGLSVPGSILRANPGYVGVSPRFQPLCPHQCRCPIRPTLLSVTGPAHQYRDRPISSASGSGSEAVDARVARPIRHIAWMTLNILHAPRARLT
jgi:hypothetical protein